MLKKAMLVPALILLCIFLVSCGAAKSKKNKVVVLGFDGASWPTIDPLIDSGKLPFLKQLKEESAWARFQTDKPTKSSVIWTCIATGKTMLKHGILDFTFLKKNGIQAPFSNAEKREPSIWQMADDFNKRSVVINWFVSHPPDHIRGVLVSDRFRHILLKEPAAAGSLVDTVWPKEEFTHLRHVVNREYRRVLERIRLPDFPTLFQELRPGEDFRKIPVLKSARIFVQQDALVENVTDVLFRGQEADLYMSYFRLPDITQHFVMRLLPKEYVDAVFADHGARLHDPATKDELMRRVAMAMEPVYAYMERLIQKYMGLPKFRDAYFFILSDHGFAPFAGGYNHYDLPDGMMAPPGILLIKGPRVKPGLTRATIYDIAPTILYLLDLPLGMNMDGHALQEVFKLTHHVRHLKYTVHRLDKPVKRGKSGNYDQETLEDLKALGYIKD